MTQARFPLAMIAVAALALNGCGRRDEVPADSAVAAPAPAAPMASVTTIETGKHVDANKRVVDTTSVFAPNDTMYVAVVTAMPGVRAASKANATPSSTLKTLVTFQDGQVVDSSSQTVQAGPSSVTEFHLVKPGGWPTGDYTVEIMLDGQSVGTRRLTVRR